ncbi:MAG: hypothetical protein COA42_11210 [Alteromonadaceae bacterium]|nr:MAG: hypothetical protein COA42_11210 [Alteromonadaceae bacterium]
MNTLQERKIYCPYCGEKISVLIDDSDLPQSYIEDCQVCCRPINFHLNMDNSGDIDVQVSHENE